MEKKKKIILGVAVLGAAAFIFKDKLFGASTTTTGRVGSFVGPASPYEGFYVSAPGTGGSRVMGGVRVGYTSHQAYLNDGRIPQVTLTIDELNKIPSDPFRVITETGIEIRS